MLENCSFRLEKWSYIMYFNNLEKKVPNTTTLNHINQYKIVDVNKKNTRYKWFSDYNFWIQKLVKFRTKYQILVVYDHKSS